MVDGEVITENGVCDYCNSYYNDVLPNWKPKTTDEVNLARIADEIKQEGKGKDYDCIIGLSGGTDSSYLAYIAKEKMENFFPNLRTFVDNFMICVFLRV